MAEFKNAEGYADPTAFEAFCALEKEEKALRAFRPIVYICSPYAGDIENNTAAARRYSRFAVESGAAFLRDELSDSKTAVKITDVRVVDSREEEPDYSEEYVYTGGETLDDDSILGSCIKQVYTSLAEEDGQNGSFSEQEGNAQNGSSPETAEQDFTFSVQLTQTDGTQINIKNLDQLQTAAHLTMDPQYNITVDISDTQTGDDHPENRCERKLTVAAKVHVDEMEEEEEHEETNENGDVTSEWTITTTTRITQIYWERGMIEKTHPDTGVSGG